MSNVAGDDDDDDAEEMSPAPGLAPGLALAGEGGRREACCEEIKALNAAVCFCREDVMAVLRTFPANFRAMFAAAPDACGITVRHEGRARVGGTLTPQFSRRMNSSSRVSLPPPCADNYITCQYNNARVHLSYKNRLLSRAANANERVTRERDKSSEQMNE